MQASTHTKQTNISMKSIQDRNTKRQGPEDKTLSSQPLLCQDPKTGHEMQVWVSEGLGAKQRHKGQSEKLAPLLEGGMKVLTGGPPSRKEGSQRPRLPQSGGPRRTEDIPEGRLAASSPPTEWRSREDGGHLPGRTRRSVKQPVNAQVTKPPCERWFCTQAPGKPDRDKRNEATQGRVCGEGERGEK